MGSFKIKSVYLSSADKAPNMQGLNFPESLKHHPAVNQKNSQTDIIDSLFLNRLPK
jgi:hypothetical protein